MSADASKWEVSDVIMFLESVGFPQEAKNFAEQVWSFYQIFFQLRIMK
jgi:hypothetical protein